MSLKIITLTLLFCPREQLESHLGERKAIFHCSCRNHLSFLETQGGLLPGDQEPAAYHRLKHGTTGLQKQPEVLCLTWCWCPILHRF